MVDASCGDEEKGNNLLIKYRLFPVSQGNEMLYFVGGI